ncbi:unnamed protein product [Ilex paraguariensis]|uniref:Uncharacterized protein n=1 Tax=Ilex paraguariensis TaxID=185542 RepID=A0ABC8R8N6_9AQUA
MTDDNQQQPGVPPHQGYPTHPEAPKYADPPPGSSPQGDSQQEQQNTHPPRTPTDSNLPVCIEIWCAFLSPSSLSI